MSSLSPGDQRRSLSIFRRLRQRFADQPLPKTEESLLLRVLTQAMVIVGIIATDVAAETQFSVWAVPLTVLAGYWSWTHRHKRNVATKFLIALGMLAAMGAFFISLREQLNDTRLVLAELLIQLQVLHSFHMPRRQDLGYSMVIGLILIGVASTLSQRTIFGLFLLLFLAIALPVLVLDYRSRLDLVGRAYKAPFKRVGLSWKRLGMFLVLILGLGLTLFMLMPRIPGYQLRSFPVSGPINQEFQDNQQIVNPGYVRQGNVSGSGEVRQGRGTGPGEMDENHYYGFNTRMNQNLRGQMKPRIVMRVRSQAEGFWRVMAFDKYLGQGWELSRNNQTKTVLRPAWSYQFFLPVPITLSKKKEVIQTYTMVAELPNVIPALTYPRELFFPTPQVALDIEGSLRSPLGLSEGLTYTVISSVPYRDRTRLQQAPTTYTDKIRQVYMEVPANIREKVRNQAETLLATSEKPITSPYEKALFLAQALKQRYTIQPELPYLNPKEDLVEAFLFKYQGGYPDHFSTTLTIMLRSIGIPARLVVGFAPGEFNPFTGLYEVKNTDAYAMTEVYFPKFGWFAFDPIPGHELIPPSIEEDQTFSVLQQFWKWVAGWLPSPVSNFLGQVFGRVFAWVASVVSWLVGLWQQGWVGLFILLLLGISTAFAGWLLWRFWRNWRYRRWLGSLPPMERLYRQMVDWLNTQGFRKRPTQTPFEYVAQAKATQPKPHAELIEQISQAYVQWRYGGKVPNLDSVKRAFRELQKRPSQQ
ncbi:transglutaminase-like enzyme, predicted cysteine protease [Leptolyngbyaceae cyanobacterium JSC-12]|nr:transglutaminase-like enzyme, predicted cysteine protease [Leptolyngbyaceae cyanobacterium JSC-12]